MTQVVMDERGLSPKRLVGVGRRCAGGPFGYAERARAHLPDRTKALQRSIFQT